MSTVLVTGFGAFGDERVNPSATIARRLDGRRCGDVHLLGRVLPVATSRVQDALAATLQETCPDLVVLTGVAPGRTAPALERVAINVRDFPMADIDGEAPIDEPIVEGGPDGYVATLPIKAILASWRDAELPGYVSNTAGTYLCNQAFYLARHLRPQVPCGLIHLPTTPQRAGASAPTPLPSMPVDLLVQAVTLACTTSAGHRGADLALGAGALS